MEPDLAPTVVDHYPAAGSDGHASPESSDDYEIVASGTPEQIEIGALVLSALGIHHIFRFNNQLLLVKRTRADEARRQLRQYIEENRDWPPPKPASASFAQFDNPPTPRVMGALALFYQITGPWQENAPWFRLGMLDALAVLEQHQWWRPITALTLHADPVHLAGNCLIGGIMVHLLCKSIGYGLSWLLLLLCGAGANIINILARPLEHNSVGFSTALFAAIGIFSGLGLSGKGRPLPDMRRVFLSLGAGASLLALLGTAGERTDLSGHLFGFIVGIVAGVMAGRFDLGQHLKQGHRQDALFFITMAMVIGCWLLAWKSYAGPGGL